MHTTHLLFLLSALASDYEHSTRPSKKSSETTNRTNKKKQPKPKPFFYSQKTSTKPCRNSDQLTFSFQLNGNMLISIMKTSLLFCAQQVWGKDHWFGKSMLFTLTCARSAHRQFSNSQAKSCVTSNHATEEFQKISWVLTSTALVEVSTPTFLLLEPKQNIGPAKLTHVLWCVEQPNTAKAYPLVSKSPKYPHLSLFFEELFHVFLVKSFLSQVDHPVALVATNFIRVGPKQAHHPQMFIYFLDKDWLLSSP